MSGKMTVVYLEHTGHVLAALREPPSGPPKLEALVGDGFPLRAVRRTGGSESPGSFDLPASILKSKSVALDERVIAGPQRFVIDSDRVALLPDSPPPPPTVNEFTQATLTLELTSQPPADTKVLTIVRGATADYREQRIQAGSFVTTSKEASLNLAIVPSGPEAGLDNGDFNLCIAVAGQPLAYTDLTSPIP